MEFSLSPRLLDLQARVRRFIAEEVIPLESDPRQGVHGPQESLQLELVASGPARRTADAARVAGHGRARA